MECWLENGHSLTFIPDPEHTPGAHQTTFNCLSVNGVSVYSLSSPRLVPYTPAPPQFQVAKVFGCNFCFRHSSGGSARVRSDASGFDSLARTTKIGACAMASLPYL